MVEAVVDAGEIIVPAVVDAQAEISLLHLLERLGQLVQRLVDDMPQMQHVKKVDQDHQDEQDDKKVSLRGQFGKSLLGGLQLHQGDGLVRRAALHRRYQVTPLVFPGDLKNGWVQRLPVQAVPVQADGGFVHCADHFAVPRKEEKRFVCPGAVGGQERGNRLPVHLDAEQIGSAAFLQIIMIRGIRHHDIILSVRLDERPLPGKVQFIPAPILVFFQGIHFAAGDRPADGGGQEFRVPDEGRGIFQLGHPFHHPQHGADLLGLGEVSGRDAQAVDVGVVEQAALAGHGPVQGKRQLVDDGGHLGIVPLDDFLLQRCLAGTIHQRHGEKQQKQHGQKESDGAPRYGVHVFFDPAHSFISSFLFHAHYNGKTAFCQSVRPECKNENGL